MAIARLTREPAVTAAWRKGAEGERRVGRRLHELLDDRCVRILHDRRPSRRSRANIDHLAVGPGGVTVIDAKNLTGAVRVERVGFLRRRELLRVGGRDRTTLIDGLERQIAAVAHALDEAGLEHVPTTGALCLANPAGLPLLGRLSIRGLLVGGPRGVTRMAARRGCLSASEIDLVCRELAARLPEA